MIPLLTLDDRNFLPSTDRKFSHKYIKMRCYSEWWIVAVKRWVKAWKWAGLSSCAAKLAAMLSTSRSTPAQSRPCLTIRLLEVFLDQYAHLTGADALSVVGGND